MPNLKTHLPVSVPCRYKSGHCLVIGLGLFELWTSVVFIIILRHKLVVVGKLTRPDVLEEDGDVWVSVGADLLVVEAQSVENLVLHDARVQTASSLQGDQLSTTLTAQVGPTPDTHTITVKSQEKNKQVLLMQCECQNSVGGNV